jgi:peroxiredoxin Q/BCP
MSKKSHKKSSKPATGRTAPSKSVAAKSRTTSKAAATPSRKKPVAPRKARAKPPKPSAPTRVPKTIAKDTRKQTSKDTRKETTMGSPAATPATIAEGDKAPDFSLPRDGGGNVSLEDFRGKKLVLFFYPKADTPGCTKEAIAFTALSDAFSQTGTAVVGISADSVKAQEKFRDKHQLAVPLMSDETHAMLEAYGAWAEKSMYGRKFMGIVRTTVLVAADGRIARLWRNVKVDGHAEQVLVAAQEL